MNIILNQRNLPVMFHVKYMLFDLRLIVFLGLLVHVPNRSPILLDIAKTKFKTSMIAFGYDLEEIQLIKCVIFKYILPYFCIKNF